MNNLKSMPNHPVFVPKNTADLRLGDIVVVLGDNGKIIEATELLRAIVPISCKGRHFKTKDGKQVCYLPGIVTTMRKVSK